MVYIRLLHPSHWQRKKNRFNRMAFRNSSETPPSISVIDQGCSEGHSGSVCEHISRYYHPRWNTPTACWLFERGLLPQHNLENTPSYGGDERCHYEISGITNEDADAFFKKDFRENNYANYRICRGLELESMMDTALEEWKLAHERESS